MYARGRNRPDDIPAGSNGVYKETGWKGWGDWLANKNRIYRIFEEARQYVRLLGLKNREEWEEYRKSGNKPKDVPGSPWAVYLDQWISLTDWLGSGTWWSLANVKQLLKGLIEGNIIYGWKEARL